MFLNLRQDGYDTHEDTQNQVDRDEKLVQRASINLYWKLRNFILKSID